MKRYTCSYPVTLYSTCGWPQRRVTSSYLRLSNERDTDAEFSLHAAGERVRLRAPLVAQSQRVDHLSDRRAQVGALF